MAESVLKVEFGEEGGRTLTLSGRIQSSFPEAPATPVPAPAEQASEAAAASAKEGEAPVAQGEAKAATEKAVETAQTGQVQSPSVWSRERFEGTFVRSFRFPAPVNVGLVKAKCVFLLPPFMSFER